MKSKSIPVGIKKKKQKLSKIKTLTKIFNEYCSKVTSHQNTLEMKSAVELYGLEVAPRNQIETNIRSKSKLKAKLLKTKQMGKTTQIEKISTKSITIRGKPAHKS